MKLRVSKCSVIFSVFIMTMFLPIYFSNSVFNAIENVAFMASIIVLFKYKYEWNAVTIATVVYWIELMALTCINGLSTVDYHLIISKSKIVVCILFIDFMLRRHLKDAINILFYILLAYVTADLISVVLFPNGLYFVAREMNEWSTAYSPQWILGNKNNRTFWYLMLMTFSYWKFDLFKRVKSIWPLIISICSVLVVVLVQSSTSIVALGIAACGLLGLYYAKTEKKSRINHKAIFAFYTILSIIILLGNIFVNQSGILNVLTQELFGKDISTVLSRTIAWQETIVQIVRNPLIGHGIVSSERAGNILGSVALTDAHNAVLNILWQGGIVALGLVAIVFINITKRTKYINNRNTAFFVSMILIAILVETLFESVLSQDYGWYMIIVLYEMAMFYSSMTEHAEQHLKSA